MKRIIKYLDERIDTINKNMENLDSMINNISTMKLGLIFENQTYYIDADEFKYSLSLYLEREYNRYRNSLHCVEHKKEIFIELNKLFDAAESK